MTNKREILIGHFPKNRGRNAVYYDFLSCGHKVISLDQTHYIVEYPSSYRKCLKCLEKAPLDFDPKEIAPGAKSVRRRTL